jgi:hypothetical protein
LQTTFIKQRPELDRDLEQELKAAEDVEDAWDWLLLKLTDRNLNKVRCPKRAVLESDVCAALRCVFIHSNRVDLCRWRLC